MIVSISEAARLSGKSRQTLYDMRDKGILSMSTDAVSGRSGIDMAELCRVFPRIKPDSFGQHTVSQNRQHLTTDSGQSGQAVLDAMQAHIQTLQKLLDEKDARIALLEDLRDRRPSADPVVRTESPSESAPGHQPRKRGLFDRLIDGIEAAIK